jgi:hypothetical protein
MRSGVLLHDVQRSTHESQDELTIFFWEFH